MSDIGGFESFQPGEGNVAASEALSEQAKQRFAAAAAQLKQIAKEEKKARKRDDRVARTIIQFLGDDQDTALFPLISRLVAKDCPSIFILAILSLIHVPSLETVDEYVKEHRIQLDIPHNIQTNVTNNVSLPNDMNEALVKWITRLQLVMSIDGELILKRLLIDEGNIDGTVLQLTTFVLLKFFKQNNRSVEYAALQPLTISVLQTIIEPHLASVEKYLKERAREVRKRSGDEEDDQEDE